MEGAWRPRGDRCGGLAHAGGLGGGGAARPRQPVGAIPLKLRFVTINAVSETVSTSLCTNRPLQTRQEFVRMVDEETREDK